MAERDPEPDTVGIVLERLRLGGGDSPTAARASERLIRRAEPIARVVCRSEARSLSATLVEELVQDTLELVWRRITTLEESASFDAWVRQIARFVCSNARRRHRDVLTEDGVLDATSPEVDALGLLRKEERDSVLLEVIEATLDPMEQEVLYHRYVHGLERERIAEVTGLEGGAQRVRAVLQRSRERLKTALRRRLDALGHGQSLFQTRDR